MDTEILKQELAAIRNDIKQGFAEQDARIDRKFVEKFAEQDIKIDRKFAEQDVKIDKKFAEQDVKSDKKFAEQDVKSDKKFAEQDGRMRMEIAELLETQITPQFEELRSEMAKMRSEMVTKSYLDDKLADLEGGMVSNLRKEDNKVNKLLKLLETKSILSGEEVRSFDEYQLFPRLPAV